MNDLLAKIDYNLIPEHVGIIMDGNGRWAKLNGKLLAQGHSEGVERIEDVIQIVKKLGIKTVTFYAFSTENWSRDEKEITHLFNLVSIFYKKKIKKLIANEIGIKIIGDVDNLPASLKKTLQKIEEETAEFTDTIMNIAFNYGGQQEIIAAVNKFIKTNPGTTLTQDDLVANLDPTNSANLDLLIRTSGEMRVSNFMLWQLAYAEFVFTPTLWPDYNQEEFLKSIIEYQKRDRRYGGRKDA